MARILSNYSRLLLTFVFGITIVRVMAEIGPDAVLIYLFLVSSTGIAAMFKTALQNGLVPALGLSIDGKGEHDFATVLWTAFISGAAAGVVSLLLFLAFWAVSDQLNLGTLSQRTITVALIGTAVQAFASSVGMVYLNLLLVDRKIIRYNVMLVAERAVFLAAALIVFTMPQDVTVDMRLQWFYALAGGLIVVLQVVTYRMAVRGRPEFALRRAPLTRQTSAWVGKLVLWNAVVVIAFALFTRWPPLVVNWSIGETMTLTITIVLTLIGYQRQLAMGLVIGLDAMVARMTGGEGEAGHQNAALLMLRSSYVLAIFATFSVAGIGLLVEPILTLWLGDTLVDTGWSAGFSAELFHIMSFGIAASILSEGWMKYLSGKGRVMAYAPQLVAAGAVNTLGTVAACIAFQDEPALRAIAYLFSACFLVVNFGPIAANVARLAEVRLSRLMAAIAIPAAAAAVAAIPGLLVYTDDRTALDIVLTLASLGLVGAGMILAMPRILRSLDF